MQALGGRAARAFGSHPDLRAWANEVALNPARVPAARADDPELGAAVERFVKHAAAGSAALAALAGLPVA
jgi:hypothetical protein